MIITLCYAAWLIDAEVLARHVAPQVPPAATDVPESLAVGAVAAIPIAIIAHVNWAERGLPNAKRIAARLGKSIGHPLNSNSFVLPSDVLAESPLLQCAEASQGHSKPF